ncbi:MAG: hypothetical protein IJ558_12780 [Treponema sp.]|nr:hypothetical protein [Treponema sp.]
MAPLVFAEAPRTVKLNSGYEMRRTHSRASRVSATHKLAEYIPRVCRMANS